MSHHERRKVEIFLNRTLLEGDLFVPPFARGLVLFAHGSGSSRLSPRNRFVAQELNSRRFATLLFDLLTEREDQDYTVRFDIDLLTHRLLDVTNWLDGQTDLKELPRGYFGASTGAAAALKAAAVLRSKIHAIVSRGGRPDLAGPDLAVVTSPTLLIVGAEDREVLQLNRQALARLAGVKELAIVPAAHHLFQEPGALEKVAELASSWFTKFLLSGDQSLREAS